jgi:hypothetical protein
MGNCVACPKTTEQNNAFVYTRQEGRDIPYDVTHVRVHSSVRAIQAYAFANCRKLSTVILNHGLEEIGHGAFANCTSLINIAIPPTVRVIKAQAFDGCYELKAAILNNGLEEIGAHAFLRCMSLVHITIPLTVRAIKDGAFRKCKRLLTVILNDGLEEIGHAAFAMCTSLIHITIPPAVRAIKGSFIGCSRLTTAILKDGLEEIGHAAFAMCTSLIHIAIPPAVRAIKAQAFDGCSGLTTAVLNDGLEEISWCAFSRCTSLVRIIIPPSVTVINEEAFLYCSSLTNVRFCDEIEEFVSGETMQDWWDHGVHKNCLSTYCFFVRCNIPERASLLLPGMWQSNIDDMLQHIPSISSPEGLELHFDSIHSKLCVYKKLKDAAALLELAIWEFKIIEQTDKNINLFNADMKMECRNDSLSMVVIIIPNVFSFLTDGNYGNDV